MTQTIYNGTGLALWVSDKQTTSKRQTKPLDSQCVTSVLGRPKIKTPKKRHT